MNCRKEKKSNSILVALFTMVVAMLLVGSVLYKKGYIKIECCDDSISDEDLPLYF